MLWAWRTSDLSAYSGGLYYCLYCDRYMPDQATLEIHQKCKIHKMKYAIGGELISSVKKANEEQYTQEEAELAAGKSKEVYPKIQRD